MLPVIPRCDDEQGRKAAIEIYSPSIVAKHCERICRELARLVVVHQKSFYESGGGQIREVGPMMKRLVDVFLMSTNFLCVLGLADCTVAKQDDFNVCLALGVGERYNGAALARTRHRMIEFLNAAVAGRAEADSEEIRSFS